MTTNMTYSLEPTKSEDQISHEAVTEAAQDRRERLAAAALQGILSEGVQYGDAKDYRAAARDAVKFADALIEELDKPARKGKA